MCLWRSLWRVKCFPPPPGTEGHHAVTWTGIALNRLSSVPQLSVQFVIKYYIKIMEHWKEILGTVYLILYFPVILLVQMWLHLWLAMQGTMKLFMLWAKVGGIPTQFLTERQDTVSETACSSGRILHLQQTVDLINVTKYTSSHSTFILQQGYMFRLEFNHLQAPTTFSFPHALPTLGSHSVYSCGIHFS